MGNADRELADQDFLYGSLAEYLDGDLTSEQRARMESGLKGQEELPARFQAMRGRLQLGLRQFQLVEAELQELRSYVQDPSVTATIENIQIEQIGRGEVLNTLLRRLALVAVAAGLVAAAVWKFAPSKEQVFKPLEYLGYEALAMEEDPGERLNLPTSDIEEIRRYLETYPGLEFKPRTLKNMASVWRPDGATVIDYEIAKVAVVQYRHSNNGEKLFYFTYAGDLSDLPPAEPGNMRGLIFQTYASDELNLIAWQSDQNTVSLLVGRRSAPELAELAVNSEKTH